eukprot:287791-Pelagomonas_calceolata.AAC.2
MRDNPKYNFVLPGYAVMVCRGCGEAFARPGWLEFEGRAQIQYGWHESLVARLCVMKILESWRSFIAAVIVSEWIWRTVLAGPWPP